MKSKTETIIISLDSTMSTLSKAKIRKLKREKKLDRKLLRSTHNPHIDYLCAALNFLPRPLISLVQDYTTDLYLVLEELDQSKLKEWLSNLKMVKGKDINGDDGINICSRLCRGHDYQPDNPHRCPYLPKIVLPWGGLHFDCNFNHLTYQTEKPFAWSRTRQEYENMEAIRVKLKSLHCQHDRCFYGEFSLSSSFSLLLRCSKADSPFYNDPHHTFRHGNAVVYPQLGQCGCVLRLFLYDFVEAT
jgi:hypothetical protein